jgi:hypothetical protein
MADVIYGVYKEEVHRIGIDQTGQILMFPNSDSEIDDTFVDRYHLGIYSKIIDRKDISEAYRLMKYAEYKGVKTFIAREVGDEYEIYVNDYAVAQELGFGRCDKYAYNMMVRKDDVKVIIEKTPIRL